MINSIKIQVTPSKRGDDLGKHLDYLVEGFMPNLISVMFLGNDQGKETYMVVYRTARPLNSRSTGE